jgi:hypothetical protein
MTSSLLTPIGVAGSHHVDLGDITVWISAGRVRTWRDHRPNHRDAALRRCAMRRFKRRDAQQTYARLLLDLVMQIWCDPDAGVPAAHAGDVAELLEAIAIDEARRIEVRDRALAVVAER